MSFKEWVEKDDNYILVDVRDNAEEIWNAALDLAAYRLNRLALDDNSIKHAVNIINECK